ncbi:MAG: tRNA (N(6)-L-threonylcarbamoyladenosine(37)-C(2))-methylthiotransferase MtaB [Candidatus Aminicenantes bacterium]|nr:MAG: tRNA (N(6)-L-threonylcarbamoyladenosine(37)-C(2))-methylthiotransferase MtaB [Candidatus Aminicenantes bacterium]
MTSFSIQSFGCRVNQAEAFEWADTLQSHGLVYRSDSWRSDIVLVNTCTLTSRADRDVRHFLNKIGRKNPEARVILTGCYSERFLDDFQKNPRVWQVFRNDEKENLPYRILAELGFRAETAIKPFRSRALIKIQDGCDFRCSFCIIPAVRGKSVSLPEEKIMEQVRNYTKQGYREIVLTGIHLCSYGTDRPEEDSLVSLLQRMEKIEGLGRIRLSSLDPRFLNRKLRDVITHSPIVCPHFHISLQHGSEDILRRMGRKIKVEDYRLILDDLRQKSPYAALGADLIVGFPGETENDFESLVGFVEKSPLTYFHVFTYSQRPGTPAARWKQVGERTKKERAARLRELSERKSGQFRKGMVGGVWEGIIIKKKEGTAQILTSNYVSVHVSPCVAVERERVQVKITQSEGIKTRGQIID